MNKLRFKKAEPLTEGGRGIAGGNKPRSSPDPSAFRAPTFNPCHVSHEYSLSISFEGAECSGRISKTWV